jgi:putative ABC transport system permease protein
VPTDATGAANELDRALMRAGMVPAQIISAGMVRDSLIEHFLVVGDAMRLTAFAVALLGAITLCAMAIFNTLDRSRELAILRAIGAPPGAVIRLMLIEAGSVLGAGLVAAVALSLVISRALLDAGERMLPHGGADAVFLWLGLAQLVTGAILTFAVIALVIALQSRATASARSGLRVM